MAAAFRKIIGFRRGVCYRVAVERGFGTFILSGMTLLLSALLGPGISAEEALKAADPALEQKVTGLIGQLGDREYRTRESATEELKCIGEPARPWLNQAANHPDPEVRFRVAAVLQALEPSQPKPNPEPQPPAGAPALVIGGNIIVHAGARVVVQQAVEQTAFTADGRKYKVTKTNGAGENQLKVEVEETKDGQTERRVVEARNQEDLAKQDAALAKIVAEHLAGEGKAAARVTARVEMVGAGADNGVIVVSTRDVPPDLYEGFGVKLEPAEQGVRVAEVRNDSPAAELGLRAGDVLRKAGGKPLPGVKEAEAVLGELTGRDSIELEVVRDGKTITLPAPAP